MSDISDEISPNVRSARYTIVESRSRCLHCNKRTAVFAIALPVSYESLNVNDDDPHNVSESWESPGFPAILSYVDLLPEAVAERIRAQTTLYRLDVRKQDSHSFWMNHCEHCGEQVDEEELHGEPDSPFTSMPYLGLDAIKLYEVREPFEAFAGGESFEVKELDS